MHQFVEPPRLGHVVVSLFVASWEIECCAPPPTVGEWTSWPVFVFPNDHPGPGVVEYGVRAADRAGCVLVDDVVLAYWDESRWGPRPKSARVSAELFGTVHGVTVPDDLPPFEGRVERVRVVREEHRRAGTGAGHWEPVPGTATAATDVRQSPRRFSSMPTRVGEPTETGVLVDVRLPAASLPAGLDARPRSARVSLAALGGVRAVDMTGSAPMSDEQWFWCFTHNTVEPLEGCPAKDRLGPYPDKATAARAVEIAHERTEKWDKEDEDWEWGPNK